MSHNTPSQPHSPRMGAEAPMLAAVTSLPPSKRTRTSLNLPSKPYKQRTTILSLPDGPIALIFTYLKATDTGGLFYGPRHAFALAMTCKRLLRIFGTLLTRILPDLEEAQKHAFVPTFTHLNTIFVPTLTYRHMLHVVKLAGSSLREINLTFHCLPMLRDLPVFCPHVDTISLQDCPESWSSKEGLIIIEQIQFLPLRSLSIHTPSYRTLLLIPDVPEQLFLIDVQPSKDMFLVCRQRLRNPPKTFHIHFRDNSRLDDDFRAYLAQLCPQIHDFSIAYNDCHQHMPPHTDLLTLLSKPRDNVNSNCRKIALKGEVSEFLQYAHPEAHVEITRCRQTLIGCADGIYPTRITLMDQYLTQDLSRLTHIFITGNVSTKWSELLYHLKLKRVRVEVQGVTNLECVPVQADVVEVPSKFLTDTDWYDRLDPVRWLLGASEIRLLGDWSISDSSTFIASLARLLDLFTGKVVFLEHCPKFFIEPKDVSLMALSMFLRHAVEKFEARGGDVRTVRSWIDW